MEAKVTNKESNGRINTGQLYVTKYGDKSSPKLYQSLCAGEHLENVWLKFYPTNNSDQEEQSYTIWMQDAVIMSIRTAFPNLEEIAFLPKEIRWT